MSDLIDRQAAIDAIVNCTNCGDEKTLRAYVAKHTLDNGWTGGVLEAIDAIEDLPSAEPEWNNHTVACLLAELFDDACACNYNGIDEWLPKKCELLDSCPHPVGVTCWEQFLKHKAERRTNG